MLPFTSAYRPLAIGLGTLAVDLGGAVLLTSLIRRRLGYRAWRAVHWLAFLAWPAAFAHSLLTAGSDLRTWWVALIEVGVAAAVVTAFDRPADGLAAARSRTTGYRRAWPGARGGAVTEAAAGLARPRLLPAGPVPGRPAGRGPGPVRAAALRGSVSSGEPR